MSRTIRKNKVGKKYRDGKAEKRGYICNCFHCVGVGKQKVEDRVLQQDMKKELLAWESDYMTDRERLEWYNKSADEWTEFDEALLQEFKNWEEYQNRQAA